MLGQARVSGFITNRDRGSGLRVRASGFGVRDYKTIGIGIGVYIHKYIYSYIHIFIYVITKKLIARHCFLLFSIRQNRTEQNPLFFIVLNLPKQNRTEPNKTKARQLFPIVHVLAKSIQWNTMVYRNPIKSHKSILSRFKSRKVF